MQLSFINQGTKREEAEKAINIPAQDDAFNSIRTEYGDMLKSQLSKGNNGLVKHKYITFSSLVNRHAELVPVTGLLTPQPPVVDLAPPLEILHDGVSVFDADCTAEPPHRPARAEKITDFLCAVQRGRVPDDVVMVHRLSVPGRCRAPWAVPPAPTQSLIVFSAACTREKHLTRSERRTVRQRRASGRRAA